LVRGFQTPQSITRSRDIFLHQFPRFAPAASVASAQGVYATALGELETARDHHKQALQDEPDNALFLRRMAATLLAEDPADPVALVLLEKAAFVAPKQGLFRAQLGLCLFGQKQRDRGLRILRKLCSETHVLPEIPFLTARAMRQNRQSGAEALALIDQALSQAPHIRRYMHMRVHILADMKNFEAANEQVEKIVARFGEGGDLIDLRQRLAA
jgi:tetratricopeptide (TPR) repeat protein